jgi:phosphatidylserine/phosphatidylglycerophosphate/cardiolipin synthase-like enzyme
LERLAGVAPETVRASLPWSYASGNHDYMEDQYFVGSGNMSYAFLNAINANQDLVAIIVLAAEDSVTDTPDLPYRRREFLRTLASTYHGRFLVFERLGDNGSPTGPNAYVHSKLLIVDDEAACIGSVNSSRRSWFHDSEIDVTIVDSKGPGSTAAGSRGWVRDFRCMIWSKQLPRFAPSLGDPAVDLGIWKQIDKSGTVPGALVRRYDVSASPQRPTIVGRQVPDVLLDFYWDTFADPQ